MNKFDGTYLLTDRCPLFHFLPWGDDSSQKLVMSSINKHIEPYVNALTHKEMNTKF